SLKSPRIRIRFIFDLGVRHAAKFLLSLAASYSSAFRRDDYAGKSVYDNHGQRVIVGQRLMQSATDVFLGWTRGRNGRDFYIRQLRDMKLSALIEDWDSGMLRQYGRMCAHALARAHARAGDAAMMAGYMGSGQTFDDAICEFATEYASQNRSDFPAFLAAIREGRIQATIEDRVGRQLGGEQTKFDAIGSPCR
ncbi:DUF2252 family protein, partial [Cupriavidus lacunae]